MTTVAVILTHLFWRYNRKVGRVQLVRGGLGVVRLKHLRRARVESNGTAWRLEVAHDGGTVSLDGRACDALPHREAFGSGGEKVMNFARETALALEMALNEHLERRVLDGDLAALRLDARDAREIAVISEQIA